MRRLLAREDGVALPVALSALALVSLLAAMTAGGAVYSNDASTEDRSSKRALAAAEAGLNIAAYRVNRFVKQTPTLPDLKCVGSFPQDPLASGECQPSSGELGNGSRYTYYVTPKLLSGACPTQVPGPAPPPGSGERCVTSVGEADGVTRRVQARLTNIKKPIFEFQGMVGKDGVNVANGVTVTGDLGTNGTLSLNGNSRVGDVHLGPGGTIQKSPQSTYGTSYTHDAFAAPKLDLEFANSLNVPPNLNAALPGINTGVIVNTTLPSYSKTVTWNAATRQLELGPGATITLGPGTYNFCRLKLAKDARLFVAPGSPVKIFIDSPDRDATCATATQPPLELASGTQINNPGEAQNLQLYIYGRNDGSELITFNNGVEMRAAIYAPQTSLKFASAIKITGAVVARYLQLAASVNFAWDPNLGSIVKAGAEYESSAWSECRSQPTPADDPESGC